MSIILPNPPPEYDASAESQRNQLIEAADADNLKATKDNTLTPGTRVLQPAWDDLRFPAAGLNPPGRVSDPSVDTDTGLLVFEDAKTEMVTGVAQMPHAWAAGSEVRPHVHWLQPAAGNVVWQLEYRLIPAYNGTFPATWTTTSSSTGVGTYPGSGTYVQITSLGTIDMTGFGISSMIVFRLSRVGGDASDTLADDVSLLEFDIHYQINAFGSRDEFVK